MIGCGAWRSKEVKEVPRYRHLIGYRGDRLAEQLNDVNALQGLFAATIPLGIVDLLTTLSDCVLYYRFDATTKTGRTKTYSHFVTTNIGPELASTNPFPTSLMGHVLRYRTMGMGADYLPIMMDFGKTSWLYCRIGHEESKVCVPKGDREFGGGEREWTVIADSFPAFVDALQLDLRPLLSAFRVAGPGNVSPSMRSWLLAAVGENWESDVMAQVQSRRKNSS